MAKKEETSMVETFKEFNDDKHIDKTTMISVLEESFRNVLAKMFGSDENFVVIMNPDKGDCEIYQNLEVVADGEVENPSMQIGLTEARAIDAECQIGEEVTKEIVFEKFGRRAILTLRQTLASKILDLQKDAIYNKFKAMEGEIVTGDIYQVWKREVLVLDEDHNELILPKDEQIPSDRYRKGESLRAVIKEVQNINNNPKVIISRTSPAFLKALLEQEVPEIADGQIAIRKVVRIPGERAKVAVESFNDRIDPVGACVGVRGSRVHGIVHELNNESIDVVTWTTNPVLYIQRALNPAKVSYINIDEANKKADAYLKPEEVSLAIGRRGANIKLASMLTEYTIDVYRDVPNDDSQNDEDVYLDEFRDVIDGWVIDAIKGIGLDTAKQVLDAPREMLVEKADLEEETVDYVLKVLRQEFEKG